MNIQQLVAASPRKGLGFWPTPLHALPRLSRLLGGPRIWIKRDDQSGLGLGGNKVRKLEFLLGEALSHGCDTLITAGAPQSNHCRQTAAAAAACGLDCHLVLGGVAPDDRDGNLLLDDLFGATIHWSGSYRKGETLEEVAGAVAASGKHPWIIPYGGSSAVGALGFVDAALELAGQLEELQLAVDHLVVASSSGGTQAGLMAGLAACGMDMSLIGIGIDKAEAGDLPFSAHLENLARETAALLGLRGLEVAPPEVSDAFVGAGYGVVGELERRAIGMLARLEGILADPVYTGRALGGMVELIRQGRFAPDDTVVFWHTGGAPALFPYRRDLQNRTS